MSEAIDFRHRDRECPHCGFPLFRGGFCIHYEQGGRVEGIYDAVALGAGNSLAAPNVTLPTANSQNERKDASHV